MSSQNTPGAEGSAEGKFVYLTFKKQELQEEGKGESESEEFCVNTFSQSTNELKVALWSKKRCQLFKGTFKDHKEVIPEHALSIDVIADTFWHILTGGVENVEASIGQINNAAELSIKATTVSKVFGKTITYSFCYRLSQVEVSDVELIEMRFGDIERAIGENKRAIAKLGIQANEEKDATGNAYFDTSANSHTAAQNNGSILCHTSGNNCWNTTPVNFEMTNAEAFRGMFQVLGKDYQYLMFGIISSSYSKFETFPSTGTHGWMIYYNNKKIHNSNSYLHNGKFNLTTPTSVLFEGSIVTVDFFPQQGRIQYWVNGVPVGENHGCTFEDKSYGFAVSTHNVNNKVKLFGIEKI